MVFPMRELRCRNGRLGASGGGFLTVTRRATAWAQAAARPYGMVDLVDWPEGFRAAR